ncbi:MAG: SapC family protein [Rubrivivax sp.]
MNIPSLHKHLVALDRSAHRQLRIKPQAPDWTVASGLNSMPVLAVEFGDLCRDYPILFVRAPGTDGAASVAPIAVFGLAPQENLFLDGARWRAQAMPAALVAYPFSIARVDKQQQKALCIDAAWPGFSQTEGQPLFNDDGSLGTHLQAMQKQLDQFDFEAQRTVEICRWLVEKQLLREMRFDADLPDGQKLQVEGFLTVDESKFAALGDADVLLIFRNGLLGLMQAHFISMGNMRKLVQWRVARAAAVSA